MNMGYYCITPKKSSFFFFFFCPDAIVVVFINVVQLGVLYVPYKHNQGVGSTLQFLCIICMRPILINGAFQQNTAQ
ncbi:hypothetical protein HOY80DRAFT_200635 [Tuber brumale]|nr:hypothetical protein HOY80DRAFT_200635 [Tuber brumale]